MGEFYDYFSKQRIKPSSIHRSDYHPSIANSSIGLLSRSFDTDISSSFLSFDVVLNDTLERIGNIGFHDSSFEELFYGGNVDYAIYDRFQKQGYGTQSLALLKELLRDNSYAIKNGLLISTLPDNIYSQKVAIKNGGVLVYDGQVPEDNLLYQLDHVKEVKVYQIQMKK